jgi:hypothetical protein
MNVQVYEVGHRWEREYNAGPHAAGQLSAERPAHALYRAERSATQRAQVRAVTQIATLLRAPCARDQAQFDFGLLRFLDETKI